MADEKLGRGTFCVPAVRVRLVQELPEASHLVGVRVRRREGGAVRSTEELQDAREGRAGDE